MQTDIYGLGVTLQTLLTGKEPLQGLVEGKPSTAHQKRVPQKLQQLLDQMLEREVHKRPLSTLDVKRQLQSIEDSSKAN